MEDGIKITCNNIKCKIEGPIPRKILNKISKLCSFKVEGAEYMSIVKRGRWDGRKRLFHRGHKTFPRGLLNIVKSILEKHNIEYELISRDPFPEPENFSDIKEEYSLRDYQKDAVDTALDSRRCIIRVATGGGKTVIAGHIIKSLGHKTIFFVHTKDLLYQAKDMFSDMFSPEVVGQVGDGVIDFRHITICTIQSACRCFGIGYETIDEEESWDDITTKQIEEDPSKNKHVKEEINQAKLVIMDECHRVAAPTAMNLMQSLENSSYRFGLSASPWRDDNADIVLEAVFGSVDVEINASELINRGYLVRPIIRFINPKPVIYDSDTNYQQIYRDYIVENSNRNSKGIYHANRMMENDMPTLILVRYIDHGELIHEAFSNIGKYVPFLSGSDSSEKRNEVIQEMRDGKIKGMIATSIADEGLDMKPLSGLVLLGGGKSSVKALQRVGRVLRPFKDKDHAEVIDFMDKAKYLNDHSYERMRMYQTEEEWIITDV